MTHDKHITDQPDARASTATLEEMAPNLTVHDQRIVASAIRLYHGHLFANLSGALHQKAEATRPMHEFMNELRDKERARIRADALEEAATVAARSGMHQIAAYIRALKQEGQAEGLKWSVSVGMDYKKFDIFSDAAAEIQQQAEGGELVTVQRARYPA